MSRVTSNLVSHAKSYLRSSLLVGDLFSVPLSYTQDFVYLSQACWEKEEIEDEEKQLEKEAREVFYSRAPCS